MAAIESAPDPGDARNKQLHEALYTLLSICFFGGRTELFVPLDRALARLEPRPPELLDIVVRTFGDPVRADAATFARRDRQIERLTTEPTPAVAAGSARRITRGVARLPQVSRREQRFTAWVRQAQGRSTRVVRGTRVCAGGADEQLRSPAVQP